ncbi:uncharacterized protein PAC_08653 [Phialocephala subalpina]|uniref:Uncharacterized protein n=1 Tax=Phialocephala subalpina TaxID=576137 RepID=A0A1L7X165_9HELO|nr:uncharacterized protein PAC_08653 [Phialocephala subalpina]
MSADGTLFQRELLAVAGSIAGLSIRNILSDSSISIVTYGYLKRPVHGPVHHQRETQVVAVNVGSRKTDITVAAMSDGVIEDIVQVLLGRVQRAPSDAEVDRMEVEVPLAGGRSRIPMIQKVISDFLNRDSISRLSNIDEATAHGTLIRAAIVIRRYTHIPLNKSELFEVKENRSSFTFAVYEESIRSEDKHVSRPRSDPLQLGIQWNYS